MNTEKTGNITLNELVDDAIEYACSNPDGLSCVEHGVERKITNSDYISLTSDIEAKLISLGVRKGDVVVIKLGRTIEHMATRLALISIGAIVISVEPSIPDGRLNMIAEEIKVKLVVDKSFFPVEKTNNKLRNEKMDDDEPCFIIFTSGSTGMPKGIIHPRKTLTYLRDYALGLKFDDYSDMKLGMIVNMSFIVSWTEFIFNLFFHSTNYMYTDEMRSDIVGMRKRVNEDGIGIMVCNPSYYRLLGPNAKIRHIVLVGEKPVDFEKTESRVYDCYGSSETIFASRVLNSDKKEYLLPTAPGGMMFTIDDEGNPSEIGELVYRGRGIMLGYVGEHTNKHPLEEYHTGDIARKVGKGYEIIGRKASMVKINGQRVEPAETEFAISKIAGVKNSVVKHFDDYGTYLCAYYLSDSVDEETIRIELRKTLNSYQIPKYIKRFDSLPLNENGKIDRSSLESLRKTKGATESPKTESEKIICKAFEITLGVESVGLDDDFIDLGGDSLGVNKLVSVFDELKKQSESVSDKVIKPQQVMFLRTPRNISTNLQKSMEYGNEYSLESGAPASNSVRNGYTFTRLYEKSHFSLPIFITNDSWKDFDEVEKNIKYLTKIFPAFSMRLERKDGKLWMMFDQNPIIIRSDVDLIDRKMEELSSFDAEKDVLSRFYIFRHEGKMSIIIAVSHLIFDGRSVKPIVNAMLKGRNTMDRGLFIQSAYDRINCSTERYQKSKEILYDVIRPKFGKIGTLPQYDITSPGNLRAPMDTPADAVTKFAKECGVSVTAVIATAFGIAKAKVIGQKESLFSLVVGGRSAPGTEDAVGMMILIVPFHTYSTDTDVKEYVRYQFDKTNELIANPEFPICDMEPDFYPDMGMMFQYSDFMNEFTKPIPGIKGELLPGAPWERGSSLMVIPHGDILLFWAKYCQRYREEDVAELMCVFDETLEKMLVAKNMRELFDE